MLKLGCFMLVLSLCVGLELKAQIKDHWNSFKKVHLKSYRPGEEDKRQEIFKKNVETILQHNLKADLGEETYKLGINKFADMTEEEIVRNYMGLAPEEDDLQNEETVLTSETTDEYPESVDWRESGFVTPPKSQGGCGSCWAFATTSVVETHYGLATKNYVVLSEQHLLDCAMNMGCDKGGTVIGGFYYFMGKGVVHEECAKYTGEKADKCSYNTSCVAVTIKSHKTTKANDENDILRVVATKGPVAVTMYANPRLFSLYRGGLYNPEKCSDPFNHSVVIIGYGTENGQQYWLIKNSWGKDWGEKGYFKLPRNAGSKCGVAKLGRYPII